MYYLNLANQLTLITTIIFTFYIFISGMSWQKNSSFTKVISASFFTPLFIYTISFLAVFREIAEPLARMANLYWSIAIVFCFFIKNRKETHNFAVFLLILFPVVVTVIKLPLKFTYSIYPTIVTLIIAICYLFTLISFLISSKKEHRSLFISIVLILFSELISQIVSLLSLNPSATYIAFSLKLIAYIYYIMDYHKQIYKPVYDKIIEAEKALANVQSTINTSVRKELSHLQFSYEQSQKKLVSIAKTDSLTQAYNKAGILEIIEESLLRHGKDNTPFSLLMFDIDKFKNINDTYGHITGDKCIKRLSLISKSALRDKDSLGRYGGDEFIIVIPEANLVKAKAIAERLRKKVDDTEGPHFTISIGIATFPDDGRSSKEMIDSADKGLYVSKEKGRNTVSHKTLF